MATPYSLPKHLFTGYPRERLVEGLQEACGASCPLPLHYALGDNDLRWDAIVDRALDRVLPRVSALLEAAIVEEYQRAPIEVERKLVAVPA